MDFLISLLKSCTNFKAVYKMDEYLALLNSIKPLGDYPESLGFTDFLQSTVICLHNDYAFPCDFVVRVRHNHCSLVDATISMILSKKNSDNGLRLEEPVQTLGYSLYKVSGNMRKNPMVTLTLKSPEWECLHKYIGDDLTVHLIQGENLSIFTKNADSLIQVIGTNIAKFLKPKEPKNKNLLTLKKMKDFKASKKFQEDFKLKQDILSKLPPINKIKMLYNPLIRKKFKLSAKNPLNLPPFQAGVAIAKKILGPRSKNKYLNTLSKIFGKFTYNYQRQNIGSHINKHCPMPKDFQKTFAQNLSADFSFEWLFSNNCSIISVGTFLITLIKKIVPLELLGSRHNMKSLQKGLISFLKLGVWEKISCAAICSRFKMQDFKWIHESADTSRRLLVGKIVLYIFNDFVIPLLQISFYVTEKQHDNTALFFYRKPVWAIITYNVNQKLENSKFFSGLTIEEKKRWEDFTKFPPAKLRVQPKVKDFRPIMHFKSKINVSPNVRLSGNNLIAGLPQILRACLVDPDKHPKDRALSSYQFQNISDKIMCLDYPSIIAKLTDFQKNWQDKGRPDLYFMCMDIAKAFDSVKIDSLIQMLENVEIPVVSSYYKYVQLLPRFARKAQGPLQGLFKMKYKKQAVDEGKFPFFNDMNFRPQSINILTSRTNFITAEKLKMISRVLQGNVIKFNRRYYKGQQGVPQGLPCSPLLSNLYYSKVEQSLLPSILKYQAKDLLLIIRLHDDYLILSDCKETVSSMFQEMESMANNHSFHFASHKISSNLPGNWVEKPDIEAWVGLDIDKNLQISPHVSENAKRQISFDFIASTVNIIDLKNKLIKMTNLTINLLRFRASSQEEVLQKALGRLMNLQSSRFLALLKIVRKVYGCKHSPNAISRIIVNVVKFSAKLVEIPDFVKISLKEFVIVFKNTELHSVSQKLKGYLGKL